MGRPVPEGDLLRAALDRWAEVYGLPEPVEHIAVTGSTSSDLKRRAARGAAHGTALVAESQTAGRGRLGRSWETVEGSLALSVILRPTLPLERVPLVSLAAAVAVAEACGPEYRIKWPNDVLGPERQKVAGLLAEVEGDGRSVRWVVVGVGLNVRAAPAMPGAGALEAIDGRPRDRARLAVEIVRGLLDTVGLLERAPAAVLDRWRARSATLGATVRSGEVEGTAVALDPDGALRVRDAHGVEHRVVSGEVR